MAEVMESILNLERLKVIAAQPFSRLIWSMVLLFGAGLVALAVSFALRGLDEPKASALPPYPSAALDEGRVLILGNSQFRGVDPRLFPIPTVNRALAGSDYSIQLAILQSLRPKMPNLELLLLGFDNIPVHTAGVERRKGDYADIAELGVPWYRLPELSPVERFAYGISYFGFLKPLLVGPKMSYEKIHELLVPQAFAAEIEEIDPTVVRKGYQIAPANGAIKMQSYVRIAEQGSHSGINTKAFLAIAEYCRKQHIRLVLLRSPTTRSFWQSRSEKWDTELANLLEQAEELMGCSILLWNDETSGAFPDTQFMDPNHLTNEGNRLYSQEVARKVSTFLL